MFVSVTCNLKGFPILSKCPPSVSQNIVEGEKCDKTDMKTVDKIISLTLNQAWSQHQLHSHKICFSVV